MSRAMAGSRSTLAPQRKKVAWILWRARISRIAGVDSLGPSSKVRARVRRVVGPRQMLGAKMDEDRPRTAQAIPAKAAAAMGSEATMKRMLFKSSLIKEV